MTENGASAMYAVSSGDRLYKLSAVPRPLTGGDAPRIMADGTTLCVSYQTFDREKAEARQVIVKFSGVSAHLFEPGGEDTINMHPLAGRGLTARAVYTVKQSTWAIDSGVPEARHLIIAFPDRTLDVLCDSIGFRHPPPEDGDAQRALQKSLTDKTLKWWLVSEKKRKSNSRPMQRDWLKDGIVTGIDDVTIFPGDEKSTWQRFADWIAQRQMRRAFGRRRTDL